MSIYQKIHNLNNSKVFAGILMILMNLGSKYIALELSETQEEFLSNIVIRRIVIFVVAFIATRDIIISLTLTGVFILLVSGLFNDNSNLCIIKKHNPQTKIVTKDDVMKAKKIINKYEKQEKLKKTLKK
jgi:hypothetical protein|uniref:Uncharacterized protein n=1 Tax=Mimiviridae sp. ChoanoV1 TaxID=2596887 RepID=A0A5B8IFR7_9VIRU|nr:hypothetical protein 5_75 [Mimiviridae sp. ChoanoV1]